MIQASHSAGLAGHLAADDVVRPGPDRRLGGAQHLAVHVVVIAVAGGVAQLGRHVVAGQDPDRRTVAVRHRRHRTVAARDGRTIRCMPHFGRVLSAMVTPFDDEGELDLDVAVELARYLQSHGHDGLVVAGTTGEAPVLTDDERLSLFAAVIEAVTIPVVAGTGTNDTRHSVHLTREAKALGAAGILAVCPYYNRPSQAGIEGHVRAIADASDLPVMVYDIPIRTGRKITTATLLRLAREVPNVVALKDAAGNPGETAALISSAPAGFEVYSGDDVMTLPLLASRRSSARSASPPLDRRRPPADVRPVGEGRRRRCPAGQQPDAGELRLRDRRRRPQPDPDQGDDAPPRHRRRSGPAADGPRPRVRRAPRARGPGQPATLA